MVRTARLVSRVDGWNQRSARLFAADCAEHVLPLFEAQRPGDDRPRLAIDAARAFARGEIDAARAFARGEIDAAARSAAWAAAGDAAGDAAWAAARSAAWAAAWAAGGDAAGDAAEAAERDWQTARLLDYLEGRAA